MSGYEIYQAPSSQRPRVAFGEATGMAGGVLGGAAGTVGSVLLLTGAATLTGAAVLASAPVLFVGGLAAGGYAAYKGGNLGREWGDTAYRWMGR